VGVGCGSPRWPPVRSNTASGRFQRNVFLALGQMYREQATENFAVAQEKAIGRGLYSKQDPLRLPARS
jgi:hypothetical protein